MHPVPFLSIRWSKFPLIRPLCRCSRRFDQAPEFTLGAVAGLAVAASFEHALGVTEMMQSRRWNAYVCPACRLVFKFPNDTEERGAYCPACHQVLQIPDHHPSGIIPAPELSLPNDQPQKTRKRRKRDRAEDSFTWEKESDPRLVRKGRRKNKPPIFMIVTLSIITGGLLAWFYVTEVKKDSPIDSETIEAPVAIAPPKPQKQNDSGIGKLDAESDVISAQFITAAEEIAGKFLSAQSVEELRGLVRDPDTTIPRIMKLHPDGKIDMGGLDAFNTTDEFMKSGEFITVAVRTKSYEERTMIFADTADGIRIDWESWVGWCEMGWEEFMNTKPTTGTLFRVKLNKSHYYNFNFSDESKWKSYALFSHDENNRMYGYVEQGSQTALDLDDTTKSGDRYFVLSLKFPNNADSNNQVIIERVISDGWILHATPPP